MAPSPFQIIYAPRQTQCFYSSVVDGTLQDEVLRIEDVLKEDDDLASLDHFFNELEPITNLDGLSEGNDGTPNRLNDQSPKQKDQQLIQQVISYMKKVVPQKLQDVETLYRSMLQDLKSVTVNISNNLREGVNQLKDRLRIHFEEMKTSVFRSSNSAPKARKRLAKSIDRITDMCKGDVQRLLQETNALITTLSNFEEQHDARELSLEDCFKKCASSIYLSVESSFMQTEFE